MMEPRRRRTGKRERKGTRNAGRTKYVICYAVVSALTKLYAHFPICAVPYTARGHSSRTTFHAAISALIFVHNVSLLWSEHLKYAINEQIDNLAAFKLRRTKSRVVLHSVVAPLGHVRAKVSVKSTLRAIHEPLQAKKTCPSWKPQTATPTCSGFPSPSLRMPCLLYSLSYSSKEVGKMRFFLLDVSC